MQQLQDSIRIEAPAEPGGRHGTQGVPREWTASVNGTGLRVAAFIRTVSAVPSAPGGSPT